MPLGSFKNIINGWDWIENLQDDWVHYECKFCKKDFKKLRISRKKHCYYCEGKYDAHKKHDVFITLKRRVFGKIKECQICLKHSNRLILHHRDGDPTNNNVNNLILCCRQCHARIHKGISSKVGDKYKKEIFTTVPKIRKLNNKVNNSFYKSKKVNIRYEKTYEVVTSVKERTNRLIKNKGLLKNQINSNSDIIIY